MTKDVVELVSITNHFRFEAPDGKQRASDALDAECVQTLAKNYHNKRANTFLDWFTFGDSTIKALLQNALTDKIGDRETFMKGIDYSYYYEQAD